MKKSLLILSILISGVVQETFCQVNPDSVEIQITEVTNGIFLINMYGGNFLFSTGNDGILLVDAGYAELAEKMKSGIQKVDSRPVKYLVNTHWHFDHAGGNPAFRNEAIIIAHDSTRAWLSVDKEILGEKIKAQNMESLPRQTFSTQMNLFLNSDTVQLIALPGGHTGGDVLVYFRKSKILHTGDLVFSDMFPFCDVENGGNVLKMAENIQRIITTFPSDIRIITGHGRECNMEDLEKYKTMINSTYDIVFKEFEMGKTIDEIKKANVLQNWKEWELAFNCNDWIEMIYKSIFNHHTSNGPI